jgi:hypothetical protein
VSWNLVKSIQKGTDMRLILPFGLNLKLGDVISVNPRTGAFTLEGTSASTLDVPVSKVRPPQGPGVSLFRQSGSSTSLQFRAEGVASTVFPQAPHAKAGFDLHFDSADAWVLAMINRQITALEELDRYRQAILNSFHFGVWRRDWALVTSIATVDRLTLIASSMRNSDVALSASGQVDPSAPMELQLTAGISILGANEELIQSITEAPSVAFCTCLRVKDSWWSDPTVGTLEAAPERRSEDLRAEATRAGYDEFWEDADSFAS